MPDSTVPPLARPAAALRRALLALCLLAGAPAALAREHARAEDAPLRDEAAPEEAGGSELSPDAPLLPAAYVQGVPAGRIPVRPTPRPRDSGGDDEPSGQARLPGMSGVPAPEAPSHRLSAAGWAVHGGLALLPVGSVYGASHLGDERFWKTGAEAGAGMLTGYLPSRLLFLRVSPGGRATELEVAAFGTGLLLTPPLTALGTWGVGEWGFQGSRDRGDAFLGALGGAAAGALLGVAMYELLDKVAGDSEQLASVRRWVGLGFIGAGATVGYQWAGGGPREGRTR